jgi:catechol 2,3-dioxygenase-like lactoylglutathione lyase family enzyme
MQQQISVITLGIADIARSKRFYGEGFVLAQREVQLLLDRLAAHGGRLLRAADAPPHGGFRGYVADPDNHAWEVAYIRRGRSRQTDG